MMSSIARSLLKYLWQKRDLFYILAITLAGIFYSGFFIAKDDSQLYLTALFHRLHPEIYQNDYVMPGIDALNNDCFFTDLELIGLKLFSGNLIYALFFLYFIAKYLLYYGVYQLSLAIVKSRLAAFAAMLVIFLPTPLANTIPSHEVILLPRMQIFGLALLSLAFLLKKRYICFSILYSIVFLIHPITAFYLTVIGSFYFFNNRKKIDKSTIIKMLILPIIAFVCLFIKQRSSGGTIYIWSLPESWKEFYWIKEHYIFLKYWKWKHWRQMIYMIIPMFFAFPVHRFILKTKAIKDIFLFSLGPLTLLLCNLLFIDWRLTPLIIGIEPHRSIIFWFYLGFILFSTSVVVISKKFDSPLIWYLALLTLLSLTRLHPMGFIFWLVVWLISTVFPFKKRSIDVFFLIFLLIIAQKIVPLLFQPTWYLFLPMPILLINWLYNLNYSLKIKNILAEILIMVTALAISLNIGIKHVQSNFPSESFYGGKYPHKILWKEYLQQKVYFPRLPDIDWFKAQFWAKDNTPRDSLFLIPSYTQPGDHTGFRVFSQRGLVYSSRDSGNVTVSNPTSNDLASEWLRRFIDLEGNEKFDEKKILELKNKYNFDYTLRGRIADPALNFPIVYENRTITIYQTP